MHKLLITLLALVVFGLPSVVQSREGDSRSRWFSYSGPSVMENCNDAAINSAVTCGNTYGYRTEGYRYFTVEIAYTKSAGGTGWQFNLQACNEGHGTTDCTDAADWFDVPVQTVSVSSVDWAIALQTHTASASDRLVLSFPCPYRRMRLANFVATGAPTTGDKITVTAQANDLSF